MSFDLGKIWKSKRDFRSRLAKRPIAEKLQMLDALQECALDVRTPDRRKAERLSAVAVQEKSSRYRAAKQRK